MELRNCKKCDRMYGYDNIDLCPKCRDDDSKYLRLVKEYLYDNPGASIKSVSDETGVDIKKILKFLREEKIEIVEGSENMILDCERCGKAISTGRYCSKCLSELKGELKGISDAMASSKSPKNMAKSGGDKLFAMERRKK